MNSAPRRRLPERSPVLTFSPLAWLKLQFFCHQGDTEIGGFGISSEKDLLYVREFTTVRQDVTSMTVRFDDVAIADFFDACVDQGLTPTQCGRIWLHTHPGESVTPSGVDEATFDRVFGNCDWAVMFILGRTGLTYARLRFAAGPGGHTLLPVEVDWPAWPESAGIPNIGSCFEQWKQEYATNIHRSREVWLPTPRSKEPQTDSEYASEYASFHDPWFEEFADELFFDYPIREHAAERPTGNSGTPNCTGNDCASGTQLAATRDHSSPPPF